MPLCPSPLGAQGLACAWHAADDHIRENKRPWSQAWRCHHGTLSKLLDLSAPSPTSEFVVFELLKQPSVPGSPQLPPDQGCLLTLLRTGGEGLSQPRLEALGPYERRGPFMKEPHPPCHGFMFGATSSGRKRHGKWRWGLRYALPGRGKENAVSESIPQVGLRVLLPRVAHILLGVPSKAGLRASSACAARGPAPPLVCDAGQVT